MNPSQAEFCNNATQNDDLGIKSGYVLLCNIPYSSFRSFALSILDDQGVCRTSGCEAIALDLGTEFLVFGRPQLFHGLNLSTFALTNATELRRLITPFAADREVRPRLEYLYAQLHNAFDSTLPDDILLDGLANDLGGPLAAFRMPKFENSAQDFEHNTRNPSVVEENLVDRMLFVIRLAVERHLSEEFAEQIGSLLDPQNILTTAASFLAMAAAAASGVGTAIMSAVGFALKGFEIFEIVRSLVSFFQEFLNGTREAAARLLGGALAALGVAVIGLFLRRVGGRIRRPRENTTRPSFNDSPDFSDVRQSVGMSAPQTTTSGSRQTHRQFVTDSTTHARNAGWIDGAGNPRGNVGAAVAPHRRASDVRSATGHTGATRQSAHIGATSLLRSLPGYRRNDALTAQLDPSTHRNFDRHWLDWIRVQRRTRTTATLSEALEAQRAALQQTTGLTQRRKNTLEWLLSHEFHELASDLPNGMGTSIPLPNIR